MNLNDYLLEAKKTAFFKYEIPPKANKNLVALFYCAVKLAGESGEACEHIGKTLRDDNGIITETRRENIMKELGDVFWYLVMICDLLAVDPSDVLEMNIKKLKDRHARNALGGSGDNR